MDAFFQAKLAKCLLDPKVLKVNNTQDISAKCSRSAEKVKSSLPSQKFARKNVFKSILKYSPLLETLIQQLKKEKMNTKVQQTDSKDYSEQIKRLKAEKKLRKDILKLDEDEIKIRHLKEFAAEKLKDFEFQKEAALKKQALLNELIQKSKIRQVDIEKQKKVLAEPLKARPKYKEIEEQYIKKIELPELERRKAELAKKRDLYQPISRQDWLDHMKKYRDISVEAQQKREQKLEKFSSSTTPLINKQKREVELESYLAIQSKKILTEKRKRYAEIVKDLFAPKIDPKYQEKPEKKTENLEISEKPELRVQETQKPGQSDMKKMIKKLKSVPASSKTPEVKASNTYNYLAEQRQLREKSHLASSPVPRLELDKTSLSKQQALVQLRAYEKLISRNEFQIRNSDPLSTLDLEENLNEMLAHSVRTKLSLL